MFSFALFKSNIIQCSHIWAGRAGQPLITRLVVWESWSKCPWPRCWALNCPQYRLMWKMKFSLNKKSGASGAGGALIEKYLSVRSKSSVHASVSLTEICLFHFHQDLLHLEERLGTVNRGASQGTIERCTYPHKYKKVSTSENLRICGLYRVCNGLWIYCIEFCMSVTVYSGTECAVVFCASFTRLMFCQHLENTVVSFTRVCSCEDIVWEQFP